MNRRQYLTTAGVGFVGVLAGCSGETDDGESGDGEESEGLEDYVQLQGHEFKPTQVGSGILLEVTVENVSENTLDLISIDANLYVDDERVDDGGLSIGDLPAGTTETDDMGLVDTTPDLYDEITNYDITISTRNEELTEFEQTYEYDEFNYPPDN
ncbi:hypothetical protein EXE51_05335 [Halorubrum sp. CGM5_25_10-8B]|uniref:hypothetical protein n=1 Tax=Halorubrum sp. CGM5_25_10-8B TaxID=2518115 RepID=UPI0010F706CE|nr:hypothetical protein [Halorubrum sp. CGM5_25_10-8B]TKX38014.1 hypothetical protein EXE51_05335 [Halorubrum sp. CGM5_25_10-8B]